MKLARPRAVAIALAVVSSGACAHVSQETFDTEMATLRRDMTEQVHAGDARTNARIDALDARMAALRADLDRLRSDFDVTVQELETQVRFNVPVYFGFDEAEIQPAGRTVLDRFSQVVARYYDSAQLTVEGFTDPAGSAAYNLKLGARRADAVKVYLASSGLTADRIRTVSYGEDTRRLVAAGAQGPGTPGWENRRVVIVVDHMGSMPRVTAEESPPATRPFLPL